MKDKPVLAAVCTNINKEAIKGVPTVIVKNEDELEQVSLELSRILEGRVYKLSNDIVIIY